MRHPTFSEDLESLLGPYRESYNRIVNGWVVGAAFGVTYPALLVETFHYVKHSCPLMKMAYERLGDGNPEVADYLDKHIVEETGHEQWLLEDLERLGFDRRAVTASTPLSETIDLVGAQLYVINFLHPAGLLGYVYVMESQPPSETSLRLLQERFEITPAAMTFLARHGEADVKHRRELKSMLDRCFAGSRERHAAIVSAVTGLGSINRLLTRIQSGNFVSFFPPARSRAESIAPRSLSFARIPSSRDLGFVESESQLI
jgi:hypothetical protein